MNYSLGVSQKRLFITAITGAVICFIGDNLLGYFTPAPDFGSKLLCINFSYEWADADPLRFAAAGACGVVALLMMFAGFYGIYLRIRETDKRTAKIFLFSSFVFVSVGTLYHNVFAASAYIYNRLCENGFNSAEGFSLDFFNTFIAVGALAAAGYIGMAVTLFAAVLKGGVFPNKRMCLVNPLVFMAVCVALSKLLPQTPFVNGVFGLGQQSIGLFIVFCVFLFSKGKTAAFAGGNDDE